MAPRPTGSDVVLSHFKKKVGRRLSASVAALSERIPCTQQLLSTVLPPNMIEMLLVMNEESVVQCMSDTHTHTLYNQRLEVGQTRKSRVRFLARLRNRYIQYSVLAKQRVYTGIAL